MKTKNKKLKKLFSNNKVVTLKYLKSKVNSQCKSNQRNNQESKFDCEITFGCARFVYN